MQERLFGSAGWLAAAAIVAATATATTAAIPVARADDEPVAPQPGPSRARPPLVVQVDKAKVDLDAHHLELRASRDLVRVTLRVTGDSGAVLAEFDREVAQPAGKPLLVEWDPSSDEIVARIEVYAYDRDGYFRGIAIVPWAISIPHEEVNFRTDSAEIDDPQAPKLEASYAKVADAVTKHPGLGVTLFIAGHTDTVGGAAYNVDLSRRRAQSIARWFRRRGLRIPIAYEGFGEGVPLVKTADEVDEPRNRRADYILSVDEPAFKGSGARPAWRRIP